MLDDATLEQKMGQKRTGAGNALDATSAEHLGLVRDRSMRRICDDDKQERRNSNSDEAMQAGGESETIGKSGINSGNKATPHE
jgi:hypothetical protein